MWMALTGVVVGATPALNASEVGVDEHVAYWMGTVNSHPLKLIRRNAARVLGTLQNPVAIPSLIQALKDPFYGVRLEAARSLGLLGNEQALASLLDSTKTDPDILVKKAAHEAVERIKLHREVLKKKEEKLQASPPANR